MVSHTSPLARVIGLSLGVVLLLATCPAHSQSQTGAATSDGTPSELQPVRVRGLQKVEAVPGADLAPYSKILLDPIEVAFHKNWDARSVAGTRISAAEKLEMRTGLAKILREEFARVLTKDGRYAVVEAPGDDVLRIKAEIKNLYVNAPDLPRASRTRTYTLSLGEMTLVAELRDSTTGDLIARVTDRKRDPESTFLELTTRVDNVAAARRAAASWARILREHLDSAHEALGAPNRATTPQ
ncbi:MAG TPA: DUF3313 family protein [Steroidobacteraceae bacterium]|nr:DUF3313 family protein [Steroidobacteraceae bacterium]HRX90187.1 DUF3313 family protein [Steroidobacteraceae bacterium]